MLPKKSEFESKFSTIGYYIYVGAFFVTGVPLLCYSAYSSYTGEGLTPVIQQLVHSISADYQLKKKGIFFAIFIPGFLLSFLLSSAVALMYDSITTSKE